MIALEAQDAIEAIRSSVVVTMAGSVAMDVLDRCQSTSRLFSRLRVLRYRVKVFFGDRGYRLVEELINIRIEIKVHARSLIEVIQHEEPDQRILDKIKAVITEGDPENDEIQRRLISTVKETSDICRPILVQR